MLLNKQLRFSGRMQGIAQRVKVNPISFTTFTLRSVARHPVNAGYGMQCTTTSRKLRRMTSVILLLAMISPRTVILVIFSAGALALAACETDKSHWTDAQLHLTAQQAQGRRIFDSYCSGCHAAYTSKKLVGPSLRELSKKRAMPSGAPPTDERVSAVIMRGRLTMPAFGGVLEQSDVDALLAYLHTL